MPPGLGEPSPITQDCATKASDSQMTSAEKIIAITAEMTSTASLVRSLKCGEQHVDADVLAVPQRVGHADQRERHQQMPLQLLRPDFADGEAVAQQHVGAHDQGDRQREP